MNVGEFRDQNIAQSKVSFNNGNRVIFDRINIKETEKNKSGGLS